ncbi:ankyrin repeat domain-containing protein [Sphingorhabdus sp.]|uniref:ankyrin repeat domain-containing protein n=1 Tax=Sphingorhabdus sp. TaxID=1902408 RepID=UPI0025ED4E80|nr:ankyrin repeat domain-containing protein [Sphingorhabdus sp.]
MNEGREMKIYEERVTPLIWAIDRGDIAEAGALLEEGADPNQPGEYGSVPLSVAARKDDQTFMKILLEKGANVNGDINNGDDWPLLSAVSYAIHNDEDWDNYYFLIKSGANINSLYGTGPRPSSIGGSMIGIGRYNKAVELVEMGYNVNLESMLEVARRRLVSDDEEPFRQRLIKKLEYKGIKGSTPKVDSTP